MLAALDILVKLLQQFEGCRLKAYQDIVGIWTIGWGETEGVKPGDVWTQEQADAKLRERAAQFLAAVYAAAPRLWLLPPECAAACASLAYNIGVGAFKASTVRRKINAGDVAGAGAAFKLWNKAGGRVVRGLTIRRAKEANLFLSAGA